MLSEERGLSPRTPVRPWLLSVSSGASPVESCLGSRRPLFCKHSLETRRSQAQGAPVSARWQGVGSVRTHGLQRGLTLKNSWML